MGDLLRHLDAFSKGLSPLGPEPTCTLLTGLEQSVEIGQPVLRAVSLPSLQEIESLAQLLLRRTAHKLVTPTRGLVRQARVSLRCQVFGLARGHRDAVATGLVDFQLHVLQDTRSLPRGDVLHGPHVATNRFLQQVGRV